MRWYLRFKLSYRDMAEIACELGVLVAPSTILRLVVRYAEEFSLLWRPFERPVGRSWCCDETYIKVGCQWMYLYRHLIVLIGYKRLLGLPALALFGVLFPVSVRMAAQNGPMAGIVKAALNRARNRVDIPSLAAGISWHGRHYFVHYGAINKSGAQFRPDTIVEIGSCTKVFTTTLFALAVQSGKMGLNDPMQGYLPNGITLQGRARAVTLLELADFSSGMPELPPNVPTQLAARSIKNYTEADFFSFVQSWQPDSDLPAPYLYSNASVGLLGLLVANAQNKPWLQLLQAQITGPLGMKDTVLEPNDEQEKRLAPGHHPNGQIAPRWPIFAWYPAGGLRSTVRDMLLFADANLGHLTFDSTSVPQALTAAMKIAQQPRFSFRHGEMQSALSWNVTVPGGLAGPHSITFKDGGTAGFNSILALDPSDDLAIFLVANRPKVGVNELAFDILGQIRQLPRSK